MNENDKKWGCEQVPLFGMLTRGYTPPSLLSLGKSPLLYDFTPFWHIVDWCAPDWLKNTAGGRLFQLVVLLWHGEKTTSHVETTNGPDVLKRDQHIHM